MRVRLLFVCLLASVCLSAIGSQSHAALMAYIANDPLAVGGGDTIVTDQGVGDNFPGSAVVGQINEGALSVSGFSVVTNISQSKPLIGSAASPRLSLTFTAVSTDNNPHTIYLYASDTGFTNAAYFDLLLGGTQTPGGDDNTITAAAYGGNTNTNLNLANLLAQIDPSSATPFALTAHGSINATVNPFSLTIGIAITRTTAGTTAGTLDLIVPEPATATLAAAIAGISLIRRRRGAAMAK